MVESAELDERFDYLVRMSNAKLQCTYSLAFDDFGALHTPCERHVVFRLATFDNRFDLICFSSLEQVSRAGEDQLWTISRCGFFRLIFKGCLSVVDRRIVDGGRTAIVPDTSFSWT